MKTITFRQTLIGNIVRAVYNTIFGEDVAKDVIVESLKNPLQLGFTSTYFIQKLNDRPLNIKLVQNYILGTIELKVRDDLNEQLLFENLKAIELRALRKTITIQNADVISVLQAIYNSTPANLPLQPIMAFPNELSVDDARHALKAQPHGLNTLYKVERIFDRQLDVELEYDPLKNNVIAHVPSSLCEEIFFEKLEKIQEEKSNLYNKWPCTMAEALAAIFNTIPNTTYTGPFLKFMSAKHAQELLNSTKLQYTTLGPAYLINTAKGDWSNEKLVSIAIFPAADGDFSIYMGKHYKLYDPNSEKHEEWFNKFHEQLKFVHASNLIHKKLTAPQDAVAHANVAQTNDDSKPLKHVRFAR